MFHVFNILSKDIKTTNLALVNRQFINPLSISADETAPTTV
jgi:hypothetical protein